MIATATASLAEAPPVLARPLALPARVPPEAASRSRAAFALHSPTALVDKALYIAHIGRSGVASPAIGDRVARLVPTTLSSFTTNSKEGALRLHADDFHSRRDLLCCRRDPAN